MNFMKIWNSDWSLLRTNVLCTKILLCKYCPKYSLDKSYKARVVKHGSTNEIFRQNVHWWKLRRRFLNRYELIRGLIRNWFISDLKMESLVTKRPGQENPKPMRRYFLWHFCNTPSSSNLAIFWNSLSKKEQIISIV